MKKNIVTYLLLLSTAVCFSKAIKVDGYLIKKSNKEKIVTKIFIPVTDEGVVQFHLLQWSFRAIDAFTAIDLRYYPVDIIEFGFEYEKTNYCFYSISNIFNLDNGRSKFQDRKFVFIKIEVKGTCKLFTCYKLNSVSSDLSSVLGIYNKVSCLKSNDKPWFIFESYNFKKDVADYFKDNAVLSAKITNGEYQKKDLEKIVTEYNQWYKKK